MQLGSAVAGLNEGHRTRSQLRCPGASRVAGGLHSPRSCGWPVKSSGAKKSSGDRWAKQAMAAWRINAKTLWGANAGWAWLASRQLPTALAMSLR